MCKAPEESFSEHAPRVQAIAEEYLALVTEIVTDDRLCSTAKYEMFRLMNAHDFLINLSHAGNFVEQYGVELLNREALHKPISKLGEARRLLEDHPIVQLQALLEAVVEDVVDDLEEEEKEASQPTNDVLKKRMEDEWGV